MKVKIRFPKKDDLPKLISIESQFEYPWSEQDFRKVLQNNHCIGLIAEYKREVVGYLIFEVFHDRLHILNLAIDKNFQRQGVATTLLNDVKRRVGEQKGKNRIFTEVRESNLPGQKFFSKAGFICTIMKDYYAECEEDAYVFEYITW